VGPITDEIRPVVAFRELHIDPEVRKFRFPFRDGGEGRLSLAKLDAEQASLEIELDGDLPKDRPFAALRSMYVTDTNNDAARVAVRLPKVPRWREMHILDYPGGEAIEFWAGRHFPSRHNTSAPDFVFSRFQSR
jgi:hypothetical protein